MGGGAEEEEGGAAGARSLREDAGEQERHTGGGEDVFKNLVRSSSSLTATFTNRATFREVLTETHLCFNSANECLMKLFKRPAVLS